MKSKNQIKKEEYQFRKQLKAETKKLKKIERDKQRRKNKQRHDMEEIILIAVYDELRKKGDEHKKLEDSVFIGTFETLPEYTLKINKCNTYIESILLNEGSCSITMEIYKVSKKTLEFIKNHLGYRENDEVSYMLEKNIDTPWGKALLYYNNDYGSKSTYELSEKIKYGDYMDYKKMNLNQLKSIN